MTLNHHQQTAFWLVLSAALLTSLIPGGPIENRDFSHIPVGVLGAFNIFLTALDLGSLVLVYFVLKRPTWALNTAFGVAIAYFAVYAVDLAQLFPRSPTPMSFALALVEVLGMTVAVFLMFTARGALAHAAKPALEPRGRGVGYAITVALVVVGIAIVWFATDSAMTGAVA